MSAATGRGIFARPVGRGQNSIAAAT